MWAASRDKYAAHIPDGPRQSTLLTLEETVAEVLRDG
jgi:hypothetical protein